MLLHAGTEIRPADVAPAIETYCHVRVLFLCPECGWPCLSRTLAAPGPSPIRKRDDYAYWGLTVMPFACMLIHMRTTLNIDDALLRKAVTLAGVEEMTALGRMGLEALIAKESARCLAMLSGTEKGLVRIRRRRARKST